MNIHALRRWLVVAMVLVLGSAACGNQSEAPEPSKAAQDEQASEQEDELLEDKPVEGEPSHRVVTADPFQEPNSVFQGKIRKGQTLNPRLRRHGLSPREALALVNHLKPLIDLNRRARPGDRYRLALNDEGDVIAFDYISTRSGEFFVRRQAHQLKVAKEVPPDLILPLDEDPELQDQDIPQPRDPGPGSALVMAEQELPTDPNTPEEGEELAVNVAPGETDGDDGGEAVEAKGDAVVAVSEPSAEEKPEVEPTKPEVEAGMVAPEGQGPVAQAEGEQGEAPKEADASENGEGQQADNAEAEVAKADAAAPDKEAAQKEVEAKEGDKAVAAKAVKEAPPKLTARERARQAHQKALERRQKLAEQKRKAKEERDKRAKAKAEREKRAQEKADLERRRREEAKEEREASRNTKLPKNSKKLVQMYFDTDDAVQKRLIAKKLQRTVGVAGTRKALVRAFRPGKKPKGLHIKTTKTEGRPDRYAVYVPKGYTPKKSWPLHISLHGGGGNGPATCQRRWGDDWPKKFILVCPTTPGGRWWSPQGEATVLAVYRRMMRDYRINTDMVTVGGLSNGGTGTLHLATKFPWLWAAVVPRCPARFAFEQWYDNMSKLPAFLIHGARDSQIVPSNSQWIVQRLKELGNEPRYIEVPGGGHDFFSELNPKAVKWFLPKKRKHTSSFSYNRVRGSDPDMIYWLSAKGAGDIKASMKRKGKTTVVHITTSRNPRHLKVYFPKNRVSRNARIILNGKVVYAGRMPASARHVLESFAATGDLRRVFSGAVTIR